MGDDVSDKAQAAIDETVKFAEELEASANASAGDTLEETRAILRDWLDTVTSVVTVPAFGRVVLIHKNGRQSTVTSPELPFLLSATPGKPST